MKRRRRWVTVAYIGLGIAALGVSLAVGMWIGYSNTVTYVCGCITRVQ